MRTMGMIACGIIAIAVCAGGEEVKAQASAPKLSGLPSNFVWQNKPADWNAKDDSLVLTQERRQTGCVARRRIHSGQLTKVDLQSTDDFMFSTKVDVRWRTTYDAGCVALSGDASLWAKLCLEAQSDGRLNVISVVRHERSDDATSFPARGASTYLKVVKADGAIFFYASEDGRAWTIVRKFNLESNDGLWAGFSTQSPNGEGASTSFTGFRYLPQKINLWELR